MRGNGQASKQSLILGRMERAIQSLVGGELMKSYVLNYAESYALKELCKLIQVMIWLGINLPQWRKLPHTLYQLLVHFVNDDFHVLATIWLVNWCILHQDVMLEYNSALSKCHVTSQLWCDAQLSVCCELGFSLPLHLLKGKSSMFHFFNSTWKKLNYCLILKFFCEE